LVGERAETEFLLALTALAPPDVRHELGIAATRVSGGVAAVMQRNTRDLRGSGR
jgi:hypothetical protein